MLREQVGALAAYCRENPVFGRFNSRTWLSLNTPKSPKDSDIPKTEVLFVPYEGMIGWWVFPLHKPYPCCLKYWSHSTFKDFLLGGGETEDFWFSLLSFTLPVHLSFLGVKVWFRQSGNFQQHSSLGSPTSLPGVFFPQSSCLQVYQLGKTFFVVEGW